MSDARAAILERVRSALGADPDVPEVPRDYVPAGGRAEPGSDAVVERFVERVSDYRATVHRAGTDTLPGLLEQLTAGERVIAATGLLEALARGARQGSTFTPTADEPGLDTAALDGFDVVVTGCAVAIAESGTIVLDGGPESGRRAITLIPDHHVCVVHAGQVVAAVPDGVAAIRPAVDVGRPLTFVSGPSATSDIELERVEGVHGPRRLDVVLVSGD